MIGGEEDVVKHLDPIFSTLAPGVKAAYALPDGKIKEELPSRGIFTADQMVQDTS